MKVLLINPSARLIERSRKLKTFISAVLPTGIAYIASILKDNGVDVKVLDQFANHMPDSLLLKEIRDYAPDIIGFSCLTMVMNNVKALVEDIRTFSNAVIVLGNIHPTIFADRLLKEKNSRRDSQRRGRNHNLGTGSDNSRKSKSLRCKRD